MKRLIFILLISLTTATFAQKISFSSQIVNSTDENIIAIREQWKLYWVDCIKAYITKDEQILSKYWDNVDIQHQYSSIAINQLSDQIPIFFYGELVTYDMTKLDDEYFRLKTMVLMSDSISKGVAADFTLFATIKDNEVKFCSYFQKQLQTLITYSTAHIDYYYPSNFTFDTNDAIKAENMLRELLQDFNIDKGRKITYIVSTDIESANRLIGFDYSIHSSTSKNAGYFIKSSDMLFSCQVAHLHELVHVVVESKYPNVSRLFDEGIATYFGGSNGHEYKFHLKQLQEIINNQANINFSKFDEWDKIIDNMTNPFYTIGAIFIDYAYKLGGQEKVESLLKSEDDINSTLEKELGIDDANTFIKSYLKNE